MSRIPNPSPPPSLPGCSIAEAGPLQFRVEFGIGPLRALWAVAAAGLVLLCAALPLSLRLALAVVAARAALRIVPTRHRHGRPVTLCGDGAGRWWLAGVPQYGELRLRRAARLPLLGWLLEFADERGLLWLRLSPRVLDRRGGRLFVRLATAGRTRTASIEGFGDPDHEIRRQRSPRRRTSARVQGLFSR